MDNKSKNFGSALLTSTAESTHQEKYAKRQEIILEYHGKTNGKRQQFIERV